MKIICRFTYSKNIKGQALVELSLALSLFGLFVIWGVPLLHEQLVARAEIQEQAQIILRQAPWRDSLGMEQLDLEMVQQRYQYQSRAVPSSQLSITDDYGLGSKVASLWETLKLADGLTMPLRNMYSLTLSQPEQEIAWMNFVRLADDWSPSQPEDLTGRPRRLTTTSLLEGIDIATLQAVTAKLPMAKELHPDQLIFGYVNEDVVPEGALCEGQACHD
ncbi:hypothetical protein CWE15_01630 [Aliidiomarina taiwanensis]|uniref:Uncharacterized protein n=1 Tax=Aliidiomarina taiwanensis TaxID=946228 RepID=A0A432X9K1_9GAMM|nr:hypothetical protein [Aliidiomarina taiwanensis]RUO43911.1 hypothetical protein CWE15_01630 [Aliidiomarina taiwanensis]